MEFKTEDLRRWRTRKVLVIGWFARRSPKRQRTAAVQYLADSPPHAARDLADFGGGVE